MGGKARQAGNLFLFLLAIGYLYEGRGLQLWRGDTPGGRFLPLLLGISLAGIALALLVEEARRPRESAPEFLWRLPLGFTAALALYILLVPVLGYGIASGLLTLACFRLYDPRGWRSDLVGAVGIALGLYLVFVAVLPLEMPVGFLGDLGS